MSMRSDYPVSKSNHVSKESVDLFIIFGYLTESTPKAADSVPLIGKLSRFCSIAG
jgi:hypothetical protein